MRFFYQAQARRTYSAIMFSLCISLAFAQVELPENLEIEPTSDPCLTKESSPSECIPISPRVTVEELVCSDGSMGIAKFQLCNQEAYPVTALSIDPSGQNFAQQISPSLPVSIEPKACVNVVVTGINRKDTIDDCNPESKFCMEAYARQKKPGFDCTGNYGFGYDFETEVAYVQGKSGFVSLFDPKKNR